MGKSRLLTAVEAAARDLGFAWTWTENVSYGRGEPYRLGAPVRAGHRRRARHRFRARSCDAPLHEKTCRRTTTRRYGGAIAAIARDASFSGWEAESADVPDDPAEVTATLGEVAARYVERLFEIDGPRVVVIDDLHWLDPSSVGLVELVVERRPTTRSWHPRGDATRAGSPAGRRCRTTDPDRPRRPRRTRDRPARDHRRAGRGRCEGARQHPRADRRQPALRRRDGPRVPRGRHARNCATAGWRMIGSGGSRLPVTLRAVLGARIDALPPPARDVLGVASVIGISVPAVDRGGAARRVRSSRGRSTARR